MGTLNVPFHCAWCFCLRNMHNYGYGIELRRRLEIAPTGICQNTKGSLQEPRAGHPRSFQLQREKNTNQGHVTETTMPHFFTGFNATWRAEVGRLDYTAVQRSVRIIIDNG